MPTPTISTITLPSGTTYEIADLAARAASAGIHMVKCTQASDTPQGVKWMDGSTEITGSLAASSDTTGKFYLVPEATQSSKDIFGEYVTVIDGSNYSWEKIGTTDIDLSSLGSLAYKDNASGTYTPAGSVAAPVISVSSAGATSSITPFGTAGSLPSLSMTVSDGNLTIGFDQGSLPTAGTAVSVKTGDASYTATAPAFTGTEATITVS